MESSSAESAGIATAAEAFVVVQRGSARLEVVRLDPRARTTVGRAASNEIVLADAQCSRRHCELFTREGRWRVVDLDSRNGVTVDGREIDSEWELTVGQTIGVGGCTLLFTDREPQILELAAGDRASPFAVIERKSGTRYDPPAADRPAPQGRHGFAELFHLARAMNAAESAASLAERVLDGLLPGTAADIGAVLLLPPGLAEPDVDDLALAAVRAPVGKGGARFSAYLSELVLGDQEAILAHDLAEDEALAARRSLNELSARSAICAPIRWEGRVLGVIHLYSTQPSRPLDADHLEFTLAVADQMGGNLISLQDRERLQEGISQAEQRNRELHDQLEAETELIGDSRALQALRRSIARVAPTDTTVLIRGESGVGKELVARAVHFNSDRRDRPFVCVNCAALTESLLESELFGHEKGAFTGATAQKPGKFEQADGGTLFLDEIGEMQVDLQTKLLRVIEGHPFERVGGSEPIPVDVRVVAATNRDLEQAVKAHEFRSDLYFRLQVFEIGVPPLREHPEDVPLIAAHFIERFARKSRVRVKGFTPEALSRLRQYHWPGNVRELRNVVERAVLLAERPMLGAGDIELSRLARTVGVAERPVPPPQATAHDRPTEPGAGPVVHRPPPPDPIETLSSEQLSLDELDRRYTLAVLERCGWNKSQAARVLGIERTTLDRRLKKYDLSRPTEDE